MLTRYGEDSGAVRFHQHNRVVDCKSENLMFSVQCSATHAMVQMV